MIFSETIEGAVASLFFFDKASLSKGMHVTEEDGVNYRHCGWYLALGVCLFVGLKMLFKRYCPRKRKGQEGSQKWIHLGDHACDTKHNRHNDDPMRSIQLPSLVRKSLQERWQTKSGSTTGSYTVRNDISSPQKLKSLTAEISKISELSSRYQDAVNSEGPFLKGHNSKKGSIKVSLKSPQEKTVRQRSTDSMRSTTKAAVTVSTSLVSHDKSKLSSQLSEKHRCQHHEVAKSQGPNNTVAQEEEVFNCDKRCVGELEPDEKLSVYLTNPDQAGVTEKMRSMFSKSKIGRGREEKKNTSDYLRFEDGACSISGKSHLGQEVNKSIKATTSMNTQMREAVGKDSRYVPGISHKESKQEAARLAGKKQSVEDVCHEKSYRDDSLADVHTSLMCINKAQGESTVPVLEKKYYRHGSECGGRKWLKGEKGRQEEIDMSYKSCPSEAPIVFEIFPPGGLHGNVTGRIDGNCQINEASFENRRASKPNRGLILSKDDRSQSVALNILEIVASTEIQHKDSKKSKPSKVRFAKNRKKIGSDINEKSPASKIKEGDGCFLGDDNETCSSYLETDISVCVERRTVLQRTTEKKKHRNVTEYGIRGSAARKNSPNRGQGAFRDAPTKSRKKAPQSSNTQTKQKQKHRQGGLPLYEPPAENIHMVESLLSVTEANQADSSTMLGASEPFMYRDLDSRRCQSIVFSLEAAKTRERTNKNTTINPDHEKTDFSKIPYGKGNIKNKKTVKKSLRFATDTEICGASSSMSYITQTSPVTFKRNQKNTKLMSENVVDYKTDRKLNKTSQKRALISNNYQILFDKLVFENKADVKNAHRISQPVDPSLFGTLYSEIQNSPSSVQVKQSKSNSKPYTTLTSFLDHKEKEISRLNDWKYIQQQDTKELAIKYSLAAHVSTGDTKMADKDAITTEEVAMEKMSRPNGSKLSTGVREEETEDIQIDPVSGLSCCNQIKLSKPNEVHKQRSVSRLHFGTDNLSLYSESIDSVRIYKTENKANKIGEALLPHQSKKTISPKQERGMKYVPFSNIDHLHKLRKLKIEAKATAISTATEKRVPKKCGKNKLKIIKKNVSKKTDNSSVQKVVSSKINTRNPDLETSHQKDGRQRTKSRFRNSIVNLKRKMPHGLAQSMFAVPDPTRGSENTTETGPLQPGDGDSLKMPDTPMTFTEQRTEELTYTHALEASEDIDNFKDIISLEQPTLTSPMSGRTVQLSSPNRTCSVEVSSPCRIGSIGSEPAVKGGRSLTGIKSMYLYNNKISSSDTNMPLILKAEQLKTNALGVLPAEQTPSRIRKRIRRQKTSIVGHGISKLSDADRKPPRGDGIRDTDLSSTSKSVTSTDIHVTHPSQNSATETTEQMPVIVRKLIIDSAKHRLETLQGTSPCGKQVLPPEEPTSQKRNILPASVSHSDQPLQSIRRGSLKDIYDRYVVHTSEHPQRRAAAIANKFMRPTTHNADGDSHQSLMDQGALARNSMNTPYQVKPDVSQRNVSSYTSKYRATDNIDKSLRSDWRGTVAFRKRLQHLLQHNKHLKNKFGHINMTTKKTSSVDVSDGELNLLPANKDNLANIYQVSRIVRPGHDVFSQLSELRQNTQLGSSEPGKANTIHPARKVVTPVSKLLDVRDQVGNAAVDKSKKGIDVISNISRLQDKTGDEETNVDPLLASQSASNVIDTPTFTSPHKMTIFSKSIITHSDHFERKIHYQLKRQNDALERKLSHMRTNSKAKPLPRESHTGISLKASIPFTVSNPKPSGNRPRLAWAEKQPWKITGKQQETIPGVGEALENNNLIANEQAKSETEMAGFSCTLTPHGQQTSHSEVTAAERVAAKLHNGVRVVTVDNRHGVFPSDIPAEVTRCDFFTPNDDQSSCDKRLTGTFKKEMAHVSETEQNLQILLDKMKQRSLILPLTNNRTGKENVNAAAGAKESPNVNMNTIKQTKPQPKLRKMKFCAERRPCGSSSIANSRELSEQTQFNFLSDKKTAAGIKFATSQRLPPSWCRKQNENVRNQMLGVEIKKTHEGKNKQENPITTKVTPGQEFTGQKNKKMIEEKSISKWEYHENTKTDENAKVSARKLVYNKYKLITRNKVKRFTTLTDKQPCQSNENVTHSVSSVKHVAFKVNGHIEKSNTDSFGTIVSEDAAQQNSEACSGNCCPELTNDDTDLLNSQSSKTAPLNSKVRQTRSVLNILSPDEAERTEKIATRKDIPCDQVSDASRTYEKLQSSTEATAKLPCSSGYGTMDIVSTTSFSQLQNSSNGEQCKPAAEPLPHCKVGISGSLSKAQDDGAHDHAVIQQNEISHENAELICQVNSSFWKKETHMDAIPEETDCETGIDSCTNVENGNSKPSEVEMKKNEVGMKKNEVEMKRTEVEMKKAEVEKVNLKCTSGKDYVTEGISTNKTALEIAGEIAIENINKDKEIVNQAKCESGEKNGSYQVNTPVGKQVCNDSYGEISSHEIESHPVAYINKRSTLIDPRIAHEESMDNAEEMVWNHGGNTAGYFPPINDASLLEQANEETLRGPHVFKTVTENISQTVSSHAHLENHTAAENASSGCSLQRKSGTGLIHIDLKSTSHECLPFRNKKESQSEEIHELNNLTHSGSNAILVKDSSSFTTEPLSERPDPSHRQMYSSVFAKTLDNYHDISHSKSDSTAAKHEVGVCDFMSTTEVSKQSMLLGERNKSDLTTVPMKSKTYDVPGIKSLTSVAQQSHGSSDNSLSEGGFKCTDDLDVISHKLTQEDISHKPTEEDVSHKPTHEEIATQSTAQKVRNIGNCSHKEDSDARKASQSTDILNPFSQTKLPNCENDDDDDDTFQELTEPCTANIPAQGHSTASQNKTLQFQDKLSPDTNIRSVVSNCSETIQEDYSETAAVRMTTLDHQPTVETQTTEFDFYSGDGDRMHKSVGLQVDHIEDEENTSSFKDNSRSSYTHKSTSKIIVSPVFSPAEVSKTENLKTENTPKTKSIVSSSNVKDNSEDNDKPAVAVAQSQNVNGNKEMTVLKGEITREHICVFRRSRPSAQSEGINQSVMDDLESLLNKELSQANADGCPKQGCDVNLLFATHERNRRREKRRRRAENTLSQQASQRELQLHYLRENDGSVNRTLSSTSQRTVFSPTDTGVQHSNRAIRPLALGRVTKLEEFLQRADDSNRSETMSNISRAVSKLSSFTSVTPSSQEEQTTPLMCQNRSGNKVIRYKLKVLETEGNGSREASVNNTSGCVSQSSTQLSRVKSLRASRPLSSKTDNERSDCQFVKCTFANDQSLFADVASNRTRNSDDSQVNDQCSMLNITASNTAEQAHLCTYTNHIQSGGYNSKKIAASSKDKTDCWVTSADRGSDSGGIKKETTGVIGVSVDGGPSNNADKQIFTQQRYPTANTVALQATDEYSYMSSSSSSIVLSWIGSDLGDTDELAQITPDFTDQEDKLYSDEVTEPNNLHLPIRQTNDAYEFPHQIENTHQQQGEFRLPEVYNADTSKLWRSTFENFVSHSPKLSGINVKKSEQRLSSYAVHMNSEKSRPSYPEEIARNEQISSLKQSKDMLPMNTSITSTENTSFETHKKDDKQTSQSRLFSSNYFKCPQNERLLGSYGSPKTSKQSCSFWNNIPKECMLEQPSYFNTLFRDPKWNPSFEIKELSNKTGHQTEEPNCAGSYVQSAWTYQRVRYTSPSNTDPRKGPEISSIVTPHTVKQQSKTHDTRLTSRLCQQSNKDINVDTWSAHSNESNPNSKQYSSTQTPPRNESMEHISEDNSVIQNDKEDPKYDTHGTASRDFRGITKQNTFLRKVHFDGNFKPDRTGVVVCDYNTKSAVSQSRVPLYTTNNKSTEKRSFDKHIKTPARSGAWPAKDRLSSEQRSKGSECTKTKRKMSLEQHLCSTFDRERNSVLSAAQPSSENGTATKSTSSHASVNWYKPQSLPSSTSVSNGNTSHGTQEASNPQGPDDHERSCQPETPLSQLGISPAIRRSAAESTRRQDTHILEHSMIKNQDSVSSLSGNAHANTTAHRGNSLSHRTPRNLSSQTMIPTLIPRSEKGSSESLPTPQSTPTQGSNKYHIPGLWWLRDPGSRRGTRHVLSQSPSEDNSRVNENKPTMGLTSASSQPKTESKTPVECEAQAPANQPGGFSSRNRKALSVTNRPSSYSSPDNSEKRSEINNGRGRKLVSSHVPSLKTSRGSSESGATFHSLVPRTSVENVLNSAQDRTRKLSSKMSDGCSSSADPLSPFKGAKRVSKLVEMFEKKRES